jgi:tetratricopeptide (TPR) repeat protein
MGEKGEKFKIGKQNSETDIYNVAGDFIIPQPSKMEPLTFPFPPILHNQTPPEPNFVGRKEILETITDWYTNPEVRIGALIGWGGVGKSALVRKWYDTLESNNIKPDGIFWWGFYRNAYLEQFLNALLRFVSQGRIEPETIKSTWEKIDRIKEYIHQGTYLIILDGLEQMQKSESGDEFGKMIHRESTELLHYFADVSKGLCLITTRYPLPDIKNYEGAGYQKKEVDRLELKDARALFKIVGVKGSQEVIDSVIEEYNGHALSLILLSKYLVEDFGGNINKAKDIPSFHSDKEAGGKAHRILLWYKEQISEKQQAFMKIFSLFRSAVREEDFEGVFRAEMETKMNQTLREMSDFSLKRMVDNLCDRRLISKGQDDTYATHPMIKNYFESLFKEKDKKLCHKRIYQYFCEYAPERPETLEEMQPLFEQVYHGCAAGLYDEAFYEVYLEKIQRGEKYFIIHKLGAWKTDLSLARTFFPEGDLSQMPLVRNKSWQSWLLNAAGLALLSNGKPKEAEELYKRKLEMNVKEKQWDAASRGYQNLADLQFRTGEPKSGLESAKKALDTAEKAKFDQFIVFSKAYLAWILHLMGKGEEADKEFRQADELQIKITGNQLYSLLGVFYADFLISMKRIDEAFELTKQNLEICQRYNAVNDISRCHCCLAAVERIRGNHKAAEIHFLKAIAIARKVGMPALETEALLESGKLHLDLGRYEDAFRDAKEVLKICARTGFRRYEPEAEIVFGKVYLALNDLEHAKTFAHSAYEKAIGMKYRWQEGDAAHLLGEIYLEMGDKESAGKWLEKAVTCRKEILDPKVKDSERMLKGL